MTSNQLTLRSLDIPTIHKFAVGFDNIFDDLNRLMNVQQKDNYPPFNIVKHTDDKFTVELAVAGFKEGDITITLEKQVLTIKGDQATEVSEENTPVYLHRGISARNFSRSFTLADYVEVISAKVENGILQIELERKVPQEHLPKTIAINYNK